METINLLGNPASPHVRHWEMVLTRCNMRPTVYGIAHHIKEPALVQCAHMIGPAWAQYLPATLAYLLAGVWLRYRAFLGRHRILFVHAHNTSGYGLIAWLSGIPYGVTTYGSEIYAAPRKSILYKFIISRILHDAKFITSASPQMTKTLRQQFKVPSEKIKEIYLGISPEFKYSEESRRNARAQLNIKDSDLVWMANRRIHELYQTLDLVRAFKKFSEKNHAGHLILIEGDADFKYIKEVESEIGLNSRIHILRGFLPQSHLCKWLCAADFSISIPRSDQLSSSILEAMQCRAIPVLGNLPAYQALDTVPEWVDLCNGNIQGNLEMMFKITSKYTENQLAEKRKIVIQTISVITKDDSIRNSFHELYLSK